MSNLKVYHASKKSGLFSKSHAISMSTVINDENPIEDEIRHINEAMLNWIKEYGRKCKEMVVVFTSEEKNHESIIQNTSNLINQDLDVVRDLETTVLLLDLSGNVCKELKTKR